MDAGQGLSVWVQTRDRNLLFDTGTAQAAQTGIVPSLNAMGVRRLDKLILSHHDSDHDGGLDAVSDIEIGETLAGQPEFYPNAKFCAEAQWQWDGVDFELLRSSENPASEDNDKSCILRVVSDGQALLVTGDLCVKGEAGLVERYGSSLYSQVLILGHHGSNTASSGGYADAYKHPTPAVQTRVRAHGATLLRTDLSGALVFELGGDEIFRGRLKSDKFYWQKKPFE